MILCIPLIFRGFCLFVFLPGVSLGFKEEQGLLYSSFACPSSTLVKEKRNVRQVNLTVLWDETLFTGKQLRNLGLNFLVSKCLSISIPVSL